MTRLFVWTALLGFTASAIAAEVDPQVLKSEAERVAVMATAKEAVLAVFSPDGHDGGSGVVISADGYALTNFHVARPCGTAMKCGMPDGKLYDAVIVGLDPTGDVALIKLFGRSDFPAAELGDSDDVQVGDWVFAMGNPFLLASDLQPTVTYGIISGTHRYQYPAGTILEYTDCLQTDASINPGNSGGPLFDAQGHLIGINGRASFEKRGRVNVGAAYAISINQIKNFLGHLQSGRVVDHATLGATVGFDQQGRVVVTDILDDSDAYRRGLRYDDEIISFAGRAISTPNGFKNVLGILPKGWRVPLSFRRDGKRHDVLVRLAGMHSEAELLANTEGRPKELEPDPAPNDPHKPKTPKPEGPEKTPQQPGDQPALPLAQAPPAVRELTEVVKAHFEAKHGYANYFFNHQQRDRIYGQWRDRFGGKRATGVWALSGALSGGGSFHLELTDNHAQLQVPSGDSKWLDTEGITSSLPPAGSGGLLPALYLWRRLAVLGPARFGDVHYLGTAPLPDHPELCDVLVATYGGAECRFYFDRNEATLLALELYTQENADPCEIYFSDYRSQGGLLLPGRMEVRVGDEVFGAFPIQQFLIHTEPAPQTEQGQ